MICREHKYKRPELMPNGGDHEEYVMTVRRAAERLKTIGG